MGLSALSMDDVNQGDAKRNDRKKRRESKGLYKSLGFRLNLGEVQNV